MLIPRFPSGLDLTVEKLRAVSGAPAVELRLLAGGAIEVLERFRGSTVRLVDAGEVADELGVYVAALREVAAEKAGASAVTYHQQVPEYPRVRDLLHQMSRLNQQGQGWTS